MDLGLSGKVAWVLGGSSGLGRASARSLVAEGAAVAVSSRNPEALQRAASEIAAGASGRCIAVPADATDAASLQEAHSRITAELGDVDVLVSNAGGPPPGSFDSFDDDDFYSAFTLTTASAVRLARLVLPGMRRKGGGVLIFLTSATTKEVAPALLLSNMMRSAVVGLEKTLSKELGPDNIRALCVAPGRIDTPRLQQLDANTAERTGRSIEEVRAQITSSIPLGRYGRPEEFGDVVAFLASERASYLTGITVVVDGGLLNGVWA